MTSPENETGEVAASPVHFDCVANEKLFNSARQSARKLKIRAVGPNGAFTVTGQTARALAVLVAAGRRGVTALEVSSWALRLAAYCHDLKHKFGLDIETLREAHPGGWHGRHVLHSPVTILQRAGDAN